MESELDLDMLEKKDHANIRCHRKSGRTAKVIPLRKYDNGVQMNGHYGKLSNEDFQKAMPEMTKAIEVCSFTREKEIDGM